MNRTSPPRFKKLRSLYNWHRYLGLTVALLVLILAATGIMLNHTSVLGLDRHFVRARWLLDGYGIKGPQQVHAYRAGDQWISQWGQSVYLGPRAIGNTDATLKGALLSGYYLLVATADSLWLYTHEGDLIERIGPAHGLPAPVEQLGRARHGAAVVSTVQGTFRADLDQLNWEPYVSTQITWANPQSLPAALRDTISTDYQGKHLSWERVVLDLHSGRIAGKAGVVVMDIAAGLLIFLAVTGFMLWWIRRRKQRNHHRGVKQHQ